MDQPAGRMSMKSRNCERSVFGHAEQGTLARAHSSLSSGSGVISQLFLGKHCVCSCDRLSLTQQDCARQPERVQSAAKLK